MAAIVSGPDSTLALVRSGQCRSVGGAAGSRGEAQRRQCGDAHRGRLHGAALGRCPTP